MANQQFRAETLQQLSEQLQRFERSCRRGQRADTVFSTGIPPLDALLPDGGLRQGSLVEWLTAGEGGGAGTLAFLTAAQFLRVGQGALIVVDPGREFYPPSAALLGIALERTVVVRPRRRDEAVWALEQSLRCRGVAVAAGWFGHLGDRVFRRLQLAAEVGRGVGLLLRPDRYRTAPSWAEVRLGVQPLHDRRSASRRRKPTGTYPEASASGSLNATGREAGRRMRVELLSSRGRTDGETMELEIDDETGDVHLAPGLAPAANRHRETGA